jgi:hypothetical protein
MKSFVEAFDALLGLAEFRRQMVDQFDNIEYAHPTTPFIIPIRMELIVMTLFV